MSSERNSNAATAAATETQPATPRGAALGRLARLMRKELVEILRDRRTIITLVLMPLLLYPLLAMAFTQFFLASAAVDSNPVYQIGVTHSEELRQIKDYLQFGSEEMASEAGADPPSKAAVPRPKVAFYDAPDLEKAVREGGVHVGIRIRKVEAYPTFRQRDLAVDWELLSDEKSPVSQQVRRYVESRCAAANARFLQIRLNEWKKGQRATPVRIFHHAIVGVERDEVISLKGVIPLILILMTITGAVYPAIDLTAGERERGTLEILVAAPVPRMALLFAKYVSVVAVAVLTALVNLVMMTLTIQVSGLGQQIFGDTGLSVLLVLQIFGLLLLFATFFSAVLLTLTSFARSFKEAQAYLIPLMLVSLAPGLAGLLPGLQLAGIFTVLPLMNIVLLARDLIDGVANPGLAAIVVVSTLLYALAALAGAARFFGAEAVLYSEQSGWSDLFRRPSEPQTTPTLASAFFCLALLFPLLFVLSSVVSWAPAALRPVYQVVGSLTLFVLLPLASARLNRVRLDSGFQLRLPLWYAFPAAALLGASLVPLVGALIAFVREQGWTFLTRQHEEFVRRAISDMSQFGPGMFATVVALIGVMEEVFFRGYLFSALRKSSSALTTIVGSALLFGAFHAVSAFDRFVPSTLMGLVLGWVAWTSRSVLPGMLLHAAYNALIIIVASMPETLGITADHFPWQWQLSATAGVLAAAAIIYLSSQPRFAVADVRDRG